MLRAITNSSSSTDVWKLKITPIPPICWRGQEGKKIREPDVKFF